MLLFYFLTMASTAGMTAHTAEPTTSVDSPERTVRSLYREVLIHAPSGLLYGKNRRLFAPYLSRSLLRKVETARACSRDWIRQNRGQMVKAPFGWSEAGLFTGGNEKTSPGTFRIESTKAERDGSFRSTVAFSFRPSDGPGSWLVVDSVIREGGRFVVNEVTFPKDGSEDAYTLSHLLAEGCEGSRWVGTR